MSERIHRSKRVPQHCRHKPSGRGYVRLGGTVHYTGAWASKEAVERYESLLGEWLSSGRVSAPTIEAGPLTYSLECLMADYWVYAQSYYQNDGKPTGEAANIHSALGPLRDLFGRTAAAEFGPLRLKEYREDLIRRGLARSTINQRTGIVRRMFRWAAGNEKVPHGVWQGLQAVEGLKKGRSPARETPPVQPVTDADISAVLPFLSPTVAAMVQVQNLSGMRSGELIQMRGADIDRTGTVWIFKPVRHKTDYMGKERLIPLGPKAQKILRPFLKLDSKAPLFQPAVADLEFRDRKKLARASKATPSQNARRKAAALDPRREFNSAFSPHSYRRAVHRACVRAGIAAWHPHRLRHSAATRIRKELGIEATRAVLGHSSPTVTEIYAQQDAGLAEKAMKRLG